MLGRNMKGFVLIAAAFLAMHCDAVLADDADGKAYRIELQITEVAGEDHKATAFPVVHTLDRQQAIVQMGAEIAIPVDEEGPMTEPDVVVVQTGTTVRVTPYHMKDGGVKLDFEFERAEPVDEMDATAGTKKFGMRKVKQLPLGVPVEVEVDRRDKAIHRVQIKISEVPLGEIGEAPAPLRLDEPDGEAFQFFSGFGR